MSLLSSFLETIAPLVPESVKEWGAREYFNHHYASLGAMTKLEIDSTNKKATLELELKGESQPLQVKINRYEMTTVGGKTFIEIKEIETSREWMSFLAREFVKGKSFEVPEIVKSLL